MDNLYLVQARVNTISTDQLFSGSSDNILLLVWAIDNDAAVEAFRKEIDSEAEDANVKKIIIGSINCRPAIWANAAGRQMY